MAFGGSVVSELQPEPVYRQPHHHHAQFRGRHGQSLNLHRHHIPQFGPEVVFLYYHEYTAIRDIAGGEVTRAKGVMDNTHPGIECGTDMFTSIRLCHGSLAPA